jgi:hypothetical protein
MEFSDHGGLRTFLRGEAVGPVIRGDPRAMDHGSAPGDPRARITYQPRSG